MWEKLDSAVRSELGSEVNLNQDLEINILLSGDQDLGGDNNPCGV